MAIQRHSGRHDDSVIIAQVRFQRVGDNSLVLRCIAQILTRIPCQHPRSAGVQCVQCRHAGSCQAQYGIAFIGKGGRTYHLSFSVDRPASARTRLMIQKRITTVDSDQPSCSKWLWIGAMRNTRLPVRLKKKTCTMTETASSTNRPPTTASTISWWIETAIAPNAPPKARLPVSPMNTAAGGALNHRNARQAPIMAAQKMASSPAPCTNGIPR